MSKKLILAGDSWSQGVWEANKNTHNVYQDLFNACGQIDYTVYNVGKGGIGNHKSILKITNTLRNKEADLIVWFQSEELRDLWEFRKPDFQEFNNLADMHNFRENTLREHYRTLNSFGIPVFCLGGCSRLNLDIMSNFENLIPVSEFLLGEFTNNTAPSIFMWSSFADYCSKQFILSTDYDELLKMQEWQRQWPGDTRQGRPGYPLWVRDLLICLVLDQWYGQ